MAKPTLPKDPKELTALLEARMAEIEDLEAQLVRKDEEHAAEMARRVEDEKVREAEWHSQIEALQDATGRAVVVAHEMADNRDRWQARVDRAEGLVATALDALRGIEPEPVEDEVEVLEEVPNPG